MHFRVCASFLAVGSLCVLNGVRGKLLDTRTFPIVDLGYATHRPTFTNATESGQRLDIYKNIRFAHPPTGDLRFRKPKTPPPAQDGIQCGEQPEEETVCISSIPKEYPFPGFNGTSFGHDDCLFLDVYVPEGTKPGDKLPVLQWILGSAYTFSSKDWINPLGLHDGSSRPGQRFISVVNNYRNGVSGWLSPPNEHLDANVGLHDCVAALEWTKEHISKFGGDPEQVTAIGKSASAGILNLMLTGDGGKGKLPFDQAYIASPAITPRRDAEEERLDLFNTVLEATNCTDLTCLRELTEEKLIEANDYLINQLPATGGGGNSGPGIGFSPVVDGGYVPDLPGILFSQGRYHKEVKDLIVGTMENEGLTISSDKNMPEAFPGLARRILRAASNETIAAVQSRYPYPPDLPEKLAWDWTGDVIFNCNAFNVAKAYSNLTRRYIMSIPPGDHTLDPNYYGYLDNTTTPVQNITIALQLQEHMRQFITGAKNRDADGVASVNFSDWPVYGAESNLFNITLAGFEGHTLGEDLEERCEFLNSVLADKVNGV